MVRVSILALRNITERAIILKCAGSVENRQRRNSLTVAAVSLIRTGYTQDRAARSVSFGYSQDNANQ